MRRCCANCAFYEEGLCLNEGSPLFMWQVDPDFCCLHHLFPEEEAVIDLLREAWETAASEHA